MRSCLSCHYLQKSHTCIRLSQNTIIMEIHFNIISLSTGEIIAKSSHRSTSTTLFQRLYELIKIFNRRCEFQNDNFRCTIDVVFPRYEQNLF